MTTTTIFAETTDGVLASSSTIYEDARQGTGTATITVDTGAGNTNLGQRLNVTVYDVFQTFLEFNTSTLPDTDVIHSSELNIYPASDSSTTDFQSYAFASPWTPPLTIGQFRSVPFVTPVPLVSTYTTSGTITGAYRPWTEYCGAEGWVNKTGTTYLVLISARQWAGTVPTGNEWWSPTSANGANKPKLIINHYANPKTIEAATADLVELDGSINNSTGMALYMGPNTLQLDFPDNSTDHWGTLG